MAEKPKKSGEVLCWLRVLTGWALMREGILLMDFVLPPPRSYVGDGGGGQRGMKEWREEQGEGGGGMAFAKSQQTQTKKIHDQQMWMNPCK